MVLLTAWLFKQYRRYEKITIWLILMMVLGFAGFAFVIFSQVPQSENVIGMIFSGSLMLGVALALFTAVCNGVLPAYTLKWGADVKKQSESTDDDCKNEIFFVVVALAIARLISAIIQFGLGGIFNESIDGTGIIVAAVFGAGVAGIGTMMSRRALTATKNLGISALTYAGPVLGLVWLGLASQINVLRIDYLIIGAAAVITANLLLNFKAEIRAAYKALIIALWVCGTSVYLHTSFPLPDYVEIVGVIATLFILILAFRVDRLVRRTTEEESNEFFLFHQLSVLVKSGGINNDAPNQLREIGRHIKPSELRNSYGTLKKYFMDAHNKLAKDDRAMLGELEARVDALTHSKQQGANFGELTALGFMGFIMVSALLLFKPVELSGWEGLFVETSSFLLATAIVFLFANIFDLQHDRTNAILAKEDGNDFYSVAFDDAGDRGSERWISITVCIAITAAYIWLFLGKWIF